MPGLLSYAMAGAVKGAGVGIKERAVAQREAAIAELQNSRLMQRERASRDFERSERLASQEFRAGESALARADAAEERAAVRADKPKRIVEGPDGVSYFEDGTKVLPNVEAPKKGFRVATPEEAARYGAQAGQFGPDDRFYENDPPKGMSIESDGKGGFSLVPGAGAGKGKGVGGKLTEQQSKDLNYYKRGVATLGTIEKQEDALTSGVQRGLDAVPVFGNYMTSSDYQTANQAGREFLASILRKDTGAAITDQEFAIYGPMFLPAPGDGKPVLEQKRAARTRAMEVMKLGLGDAGDLADADVTQNPGAAGDDAGTGTAGTGGASTAAPPRRARNPKTGEMVELRNGKWEPVR